METKLFRSGNSQAVRIPKELAFPGDMRVVEIERQGDALIVWPVRHRSLAGVLRKFAGFPPNFMAEGRLDEADEERAGW
jgi:antitoxin VapB